MNKKLTKKLHVHLYIDNEIEKIITCNVAFMLLLTIEVLDFPFLYCFPLVEWYMIDIDKS